MKLFQSLPTLNDTDVLRIELHGLRESRDAILARVRALEAREEALLKHLGLYIEVTQPRTVVRSKGGPESGE